MNGHYDDTSFSEVVCNYFNSRVIQELVKLLDDEYFLIPTYEMVSNEYTRGFSNKYNKIKNTLKNHPKKPFLSAYKINENNKVIFNVEIITNIFDAVKRECLDKYVIEEEKIEINYNNVIYKNTIKEAKYFLFYLNYTTQYNHGAYHYEPTTMFFVKTPLHFRFFSQNLENYKTLILQRDNILCIDKILQSSKFNRTIDKLHTNTDLQKFKIMDVYLRYEHLLVYSLHIF